MPEKEQVAELRGGKTQGRGGHHRGKKLFQEREAGKTNLLRSGKREGDYHRSSEKRNSKIFYFHVSSSEEVASRSSVGQKDRSEPLDEAREHKGSKRGKKTKKERGQGRRGGTKRGREKKNKGDEKEVTGNESAGQPRSREGEKSANK